ncbi:MAG: FAD:protein FMN transferase, partial [Verrucomicrobia bacterium]|nr:FAD:protein FMN transferase [Verrucomicrobiota bacterium]
AARAVGWQKVKLDAHAQTVTLAAPNMKLDLGGIAKGYGADAALTVLKQRGLPRALVAASGDLAVGDPPPGKPGWIIGIAALDEGDGALTKLLSLRNCGVSTSGDTEQFVIIGGVRYSHIVDPRTGIGLTNRIQATVIARDATTSDAMAKGVCVFGPERGRALIDALPGAATLVLTAGDGGRKQFASKRFQKLPSVE